MSATAAVIIGVTLTLAVCLVAASPPAARLAPARELRLGGVKPKPALSAAGGTGRAQACCGDLGCFNSGGEFFSWQHRPIDSVPNCGLQSNLKLLLNTRRSPIETQRLDPYDAATFQHSHFNASAKTQILIHGYIDNFRWPWWTQTVLELLKHGDHNVIRVDWAHGNTFPYVQATANVRLVGAYVAKVIGHLVLVQGVNPADIHIIGHSLGAHGAGYAGTTARELHNIVVGRITGLDPAGPYFSNMPLSVRLDPSDAAIVDTIVTDGESTFNSSILAGLGFAFGSPQAMGHINFFPNGGLNQPGCDNGILGTIFGGPSMNSSTFDIFGNIAATSLEVVACNHARAAILFHESINNPSCTMKSFQCDSYQSFLRGDCFTCRGKRCSTLGLHADLSLVSPGEVKNFYTMTTARSPFCTSPHKVQFSLKTKAAESNSKQQEGYVYVTLYGTLATSGKILLNADKIDLNPGQTYTFFFETTKELGTVQSIVFFWESSFSINPLDWFRKHYIYLDGALLLTEQDDLVSSFAPARVQVEEEKDMLAPLSHSFEQRKPSWLSQK